MAAGARRIRWRCARPAGHGSPEPPEFLPAEGEDLHQIPVGPVHAGIIEPGHFRFTAQGETVVRLEARLGYTHKGQLALMRGKSPRVAARFAARLSGDSTVAHADRFRPRRRGRAGRPTRRPARTRCARVMAELERIANHLGDVGPSATTRPSPSPSRGSACIARRCCGPAPSRSATG